MNIDEQAAKELLASSGISIPRGSVVTTPEQAEQAARKLGGSVVIKPLIAAGRRGKAGLVRFADDGARAREEATELLASTERLRVEERIELERELYVAIATDRSLKCPVVLYSEDGGVDVESASAITKRAVDIRRGMTAAVLRAFPEKLHAILTTLYTCYRDLDAELFEVNPLAETPRGDFVALDAKLVIDDSSLARHAELVFESPPATELEEQARLVGLYYIELDGDIGVLANGAGLTMATLDAVRFHGGRPANFMEIGGDAYRKGKEALAVVLGNPHVKVLLVNLCGAYARTDVMIEGFLDGWQALGSSVPVVLSIHGTGEERAIRLVRDALGIEPFDEMDDAVKAAIRHAKLS